MQSVIERNVECHELNYAPSVVTDIHRLSYGHTSRRDESYLRNGNSTSRKYCATFTHVQLKVRQQFTNALFCSTVCFCLRSPPKATHTGTYIFVFMRIFAKPSVWASEEPISCNVLNICRRATFWIQHLCHLPTSFTWTKPLRLWGSLTCMFHNVIATFSKYSSYARWELRYIHLDNKACLPLWR